MEPDENVPRAPRAPRRSAGLQRLVRAPFVAVLTGLALWLSARAIWTVVSIVHARAGYPYDLEWMEGGMVDHSLRVLEGLPLYVEPSFEFTPFVYNPLYYVFGAGAIAAFGPGPVALRLVSILFTLVFCAVLFELVRRATRSALAAFLATGAMVATYELSGGWFDLARADTTFLALEGLAVLVALSPRRGAVLLSALLVALAFLAKQYAIVCAAPIALYLLLARGPAVALRFGLLAAAFAGGAVAWLQWTSDGWFLFYTFEIPAAHPLAWGAMLQMARSHVSGPSALLVVLAVFGAATLTPALRAGGAAARAAREGRARAALLLAFAGVLIVQAALSYAHVGSFLNCLMPGHLALALLAGCGLGALRSRSDDERDDVRDEDRRAAAVLVLTAFCVQLLALPIDRERWIPDAADLATGRAIEASLASTDAPQLVAYRGFFGSPGAHAPHAHQMALLDLFKVREQFGEHVDRVLEQAEAHFATRPYGRILLDNVDYVFGASLERHYQPVRSIEDETFWTRSGARLRPRLELVPAGPR